jgi:hypothetical protein
VLALIFIVNDNRLEMDNSDIKNCVTLTGGTNSLLRLWNQRITGLD